MSRPSPTHLESLAEVDDRLDPADPDALFTAFAVLSGRREGRTKDGKPYVDLHVADLTNTVPAKIWGEQARALEQARTMTVGDPVKVLFHIRSFRGATQLNVVQLRPPEPDEEGYEPDELYGPGFAAVADLRCRTLVFDIETVPATDRRAAPSTIAQAVSKHAQRTESDESKVMSLSPFFGKVVSLALGEGEVEDPDSEDITVLVVPPPGREEDEFPAWIRPMSEADLLQAFWTLASLAEVVVTYNGRGFDVPFLIARSLVHSIPVRVDLMKFGNRPHLDLYKAVGGGGRPLGPGSLDVVCWALGIESPKGVMDGSMVAPTYARGDIETIAEYNAGDVAATTAVYQHVRDHLLRYRDDW